MLPKLAELKKIADDALAEHDRQYIATHMEHIAKALRATALKGSRTLRYFAVNATNRQANLIADAIRAEGLTVGKIEKQVGEYYDQLDYTNDGYYINIAGW